MRRYLVFFVIILGIARSAAAQFYDEQDVRRALGDELKENMKNLQQKEPKPFFISYTINDGLTINISSSHGATVSSAVIPAKGYNVRLLIGDYEFNDESFDGESDRNLGFTTIELPVESDYFGIRRALWASTDLVYKSAAKLYRGHQNYVDNQGKPIEQIPHRRFARADSVAISDDGVASVPDRKVLEAYTNALSAVFLNYPEIDFSGVTLSGYQEYSYFLSTEGSWVKQLKGVMDVKVFAMARTGEGQPLIAQRNFTAVAFDELPDQEKAVAEVEKMANELLALFDAQPLDESYYGPVLFLGQASASLLSRSLDLQPGGLKDSDFIPSSKNFLYNSAGSSELKPGKKVASDGISIKAMAAMQEFNGKQLVGSFLADSEGVLPADELVLVENGVVRNLLGDRTITENGQRSTGHASGAGVIMISSEATATEEELKARLIQLAKEEVLDYALIVREADFGVLPIFNVYKVSLEDGSETLLRAAMLRQLDMKIFRKIAGCSGELVVHNAAGLDNPVFPTTVIAPSAVLVKEMEVERASNPAFNSTPYVKNPLNE